MPLAVEVDDVARRFGRVQALAGVDLAVEEGEFFGLLGPNGAGKTTLISILAGLTRADRGTRARAGPRRRRRLPRRAPQRSASCRRSSCSTRSSRCARRCAIQSGYFGLRNNDAWIDEILHHLDLTSKADANMRSLSGGMKRRVLVGQALVHKPPVIVLDEPTAGVDVELRQSLWAFIRKLNRDGHTIILTTHYLEEAEALCGRIAMLKAGPRRRARHDAEPADARSRGSPCASSRSAFPPALAVAGDEPRRTASSSSASSATPSSRRCSPRCASRTSRSTSWRSQETDLEQVFLQIMGAGRPAAERPP